MSERPRVEIGAATGWPDGGEPTHRANHAIREWLWDDVDRRELYDRIEARGGWLPFPSRSKLSDDPTPILEPSAPHGHQIVRLVCDPDAIRTILSSRDFGVAAYRALGSGQFMLGMEPASGMHSGIPWHSVQKKEAVALLGVESSHCATLAKEAIRQAGVISLATRHVDLAAFAEQVALRFCAMVFGFSAADHALLQEAARRSYRALTYQLIGRHFVSEPETPAAAQVAAAKLVQRADRLIVEYDRLRRYPEDEPRPNAPNRHRHGWPTGVDPPVELGAAGFVPLLRKMALHDGPLTGHQLAVMAAGLVAGTVGNVQASVCIAVDAHLRAGMAPDDPRLDAMTAAALRENPPVAFVSRLALRDIDGTDIRQHDEVVLCMGAATVKEAPSLAMHESLVFGAPGLHSCVGSTLVWPLVTQTVTSALRLNGLARRVNAATREPDELAKRWGTACESFPLVYRRERRVAQQPLQVIMRVRAPVAENATLIRAVIRDGAPRIERALRKSRHVHFAWFQLIDDDTRLVLQTVYDGDFDAYILHFALVVDDVFDSLFRYIEDAPPLPVSDHPEAFVETIRRHHRTPAENYFFSAYADLEVQNVNRIARAPRWP